MPKLITCRGIGERFNAGVNMGDLLARELPNFQRVDVAYKSEYGPAGGRILGQAFDLTLTEGTAMLRAELDKGPAVVAGYSAGAAIAGHVAAGGHPNLKAVALVADPFQPTSASGFNGSWGVAGSRPILNNVPAKWVYNPNDMICQSKQNSPIRTIADQTADLSLAAPGAWALDLLFRWVHRKWQPINPPASAFDVWNRYQDGKNALEGYLFRGEHTAAYSQWPVQRGRTRISVLADWVREVGQ